MDLNQQAHPPTHYEKTLKESSDRFSLFPASQALPTVHTDDPAAVRTGPAGAFPPDEALHSKGLDDLQILEHAHAVLRPITFVQLLHAGAGKLVTIHAQA